MPNKTPSGISIAEIAKRLHVSRNYVYTVVLPGVKHGKAIGGRMEVDETDLRRWLMENSVFTRQTKFVSEVAYDSTEYCTMLAACNIHWDCPPPHQRNKLPNRKVNPFDFWDKELLFPDDGRFNNPESFYRAMFECAAIKIRLGERKVLFYAPALKDVLIDKEHERRQFEEDAKGHYLPPLGPAMYLDIDSKTGAAESILLPGLYPAIDADVEAKYLARQKKENPPVVIQIKGDPDRVRQIKEILLHSGLYSYRSGIEKTESESGDAVFFKIPPANVGYWSEEMEKMQNRLHTLDEIEGERIDAEMNAMIEELYPEDKKKDNE